MALRLTQYTRSPREIDSLLEIPLRQLRQQPGKPTRPTSWSLRRECLGNSFLKMISISEQNSFDKIANDGAKHQGVVSPAVTRASPLVSDAGSRTSIFERLFRVCLSETRLNQQTGLCFTPQRIDTLCAILVLAKTALVAIYRFFV